MKSTKIQAQSRATKAAHGFGWDFSEDKQPFSVASIRSLEVQMRAV
jgi:hypothetical protein